jgi:DNA-binding NtrC family response regulator
MAPGWIVVADEDEGGREALSWALRAHGYRVVAVGTADSTREALVEYPVALLILDASISGPDVAWFVEQSRRTTGESSSLLVIWTAPEPSSAAAHLAFVKKPFRTDQVVELADAILGQAARRTPPGGLPPLGSVTSSSGLADARRSQTPAPGRSTKS